MKNTTIVALTFAAVVALTLFVPANVTIGSFLSTTASILGIIAFIRGNGAQTDEKRAPKSPRFKMKIEIQI